MGAKALTVWINFLSHGADLLSTPPATAYIWVRSAKFSNVSGGFGRSTQSRWAGPQIESKW